MTEKKFGFATKGVLLAAIMVLIMALGLYGCGNDPAVEEEAESDVLEAEGYEAYLGDANLVNDGQLTVAASLDFPPFENMGEGSTEAEGFGVDLMKALGNELGLEVVYLPTQAFDTIIPTIQSGTTADVGVSSFTVTDERLEQVDFTDTYMVSNQGVAVLKDSDITADNYMDALQGKTIATQSGTTGYDWAVENIPDADVVPYQEMTAVFAALQSGQAQAVIADLPVVQYYVSHGYEDADVIAEIPTGEVYAIAVNKDNPALTKALNAALQALRENGTYDQIYAEWFGTTPSDSATN